MRISLSGADFQKILNDAISQAATTGAGKTATATVNGKSLTISYTDASGNKVTMEPIELDEANDGGILADPAAIKDLMDKIEKSFSAKDIKLDKKLLDDFAKCLQNAIDKAKLNGKFSSIHDMYLVLFEIIALLQQANHTMKKAAIASRSSAMAAEIQAINSQASKERDAALTGLFTSIGVGLLQAGVSGYMKYKEIKGEINANKMLKTPIAEVDQKLLDSAKLLGTPESAETRMNKFAKNENLATMHKIAAEVGGYAVDENSLTHTSASPEDLGATGKGYDLGVANAKADLDKAIDMRDNPDTFIEEVEVPANEQSNQGKTETEKGFHIKGDDKGTTFKTKQEAVDALKNRVEEKKANLVSLVDGKVDQIRSERDQAANRLDVAKKELTEAELAAKQNPCEETKNALESCKVKFEQCKDAFENYNKDLLYADSVRTNLLSHGVGPNNEPLLSGTECAKRLDGAKMTYEMSRQKATLSPEYQKAVQDAKEFGLVGAIITPLLTMLNQLPQSISGIMSANAQKQGVEKLKAEAQYSAANDLIQQIAKSQEMTISMFAKLFDSYLNTQRTAIRA